MANRICRACNAGWNTKRDGNKCPRGCDTKTKPGDTKPKGHK